MKRILLTLTFMMSLLSFNSVSVQNEAPKGKLIYCSYSCRRPAAGGTEYCELIADSGQVPKVRVVLWENCHWHKEAKREFTAGPLDVAKMQQLLNELEVWKLSGYQHDEMLDGGATYRIYQEYSTGEKYNASWSGHHVSADAEAAYSRIKDFFALWRESVETESEER